MTPWPDLRATLSGIPWVIVGGAATRAFMAERVTKDLGVLVRSEDGLEALDRLTEAGFAVVSELSRGGYVLRSQDGVEVDLLLSTEPWFAEAVATPAQDAAGYPIMDLPFLVLMKLTSARTQDWADVARMLGQATADRLDAVREVVRRFSPDDVEDLESQIYLGQMEMDSPAPGESGENA